MLWLSPQRVFWGLFGITVAVAMALGWGFARAGGTGWQGLLSPAGELELRVALAPGGAGRCVPLVAMGRPGAVTLLYVRYTSPDHVVFGYDLAGAGGPVSAPVALESGRMIPLAVRMPAFPGPGTTGSAGWLRLVYAGRLLVDEKVPPASFQPGEVWFGHDLDGGKITNARFSGRIAALDGKRLNREGGGVRPVLRGFLQWVQWEPFAAAGSLLGLALLSGAALLLARRAYRVRDDWDRPFAAGRSRPPHLVFGAVAAGCVLFFAVVISGGTFRLFAPESFTRFYDDQAASLLRGRLDVPRESLEGEAFLFEGKVYGYFGPTPAVLRIPFAVAGVPPGRLSRAFMVLYFAASLGAAYALLIQAARIAAGAGAWPARFEVVLLTLATGLGSTLFFLGSRAYIYHEAILCGAAFALWSLVASLSWLRAHGRSLAWLPALAAGVLAVHARPPAGLGALATLGCTAAFLLYRRLATPGGAAWTGVPRLAVVGVLAVAGVFSFNALSYLKFRSLEGAPLRYNVQYGPERLDRIEGRNFHVGNLPFGLAGYGFLATASLRPTFPFLYMRYTESAGFPGARIDLAENTLALPWAMPGLTWLALSGFLLAALRWPGASVPVLILAGGLAPLALAMLTAVAQSHRYTADFVPCLIALAAFGLAGSKGLAPRLRRAWLTVGACLALVAAAVTLAITIQYQGEVVWGVEPEIKARFLELRRWSDRVLGFDR